MSDDKPTILFIDSVVADRHHWINGLQKGNKSYSIIEANDGRSGLELLQHRKVDCVVLELNLSDMSGLLLLQRMVPVNGLRATALIVLTRLTIPALAELAMKNGAHACLVKRWTSVDQLEKAILKAIATVEASLKENPS